MCKGTEAGKGRVESSGDLKRLKLEVGNLRSPSQGPDLRWWPWPWLSGIGQRKIPEGPVPGVPRR